MKKAKKSLIDTKSNLPILSVITIVRNGEDIIENTILSVINQNYQNIEYIVIDGNSNDGTVDIIKKYEDKISFWISETDNGIYDAMNKGISKAKGGFLNFMNAGDVFIDSDICQVVANHILKKECDIFYGDYIAKSDTNNVEKLLKAKSLDKIWQGMVFCHQSAFIKLSDLKKIPFDLKYEIVADYNQILLFYSYNKKFHYISTVISKVAIGGVSYSNPKTIIEQIKIIHSHRPYSLTILRYMAPLIISAIIAIIGAKKTSYLREFKWRFFSNIKH